VGYRRIILDLLDFQDLLRDGYECTNLPSDFNVCSCNIDKRHKDRVEFIISSKTFPETLPYEKLPVLQLEWR
jgi:hypothetical protein